MLFNSREFKFLKNYRNVYGKLSAKREYRDENVFLKVDRALSKLITLFISNKKEFNHFSFLRAKRAMSNLIFVSEQHGEKNLGFIVRELNMF